MYTEEAAKKMCPLISPRQSGGLHHSNCVTTKCMAWVDTSKEVGKPHTGYCSALHLPEYVKL